jgi:Protein of unknown function (DUF2793)/Chaperone of endosialidase
MADDSTNLGIKFLQASQADKHVAVNEAFDLLDVLVGQSVKGFGTNQAPTSNQEGDAFVIGTNPSQAWTGKASQMAVWKLGAWQFLQPRRGWQVREIDANFATKIYTGTDWQALDLIGASASKLTSIGLGTDASVATPFAAVLNQASWTARGIVQGGTGDLRIYAGKSTSSQTVSTVFQTGFSGRAEVGLCGDDLYSIRVSANGSTWRTAFSIDPITAKASFPVGTVIVDGVEIGRGGSGIASNTSIGASALSANVSGAETTALGNFALASNTTGGQNTAIGRYALGSNTTGSGNVAAGQIALFFNTTGTNNTAIGQASLYSNTVGNENTAIGHASLASTIGGSQNTAVGLFALYSNSSGSQNTAIGRYALSAATNFSNCSALGHNAQVSGNNQIQLGDSSTTTYVYGTVQSRSDARDKTDVRDTVHGLAFIRALRPVDYRWNYREDYSPLAQADASSGASPLGKSTAKLTSPSTHKFRRNRYHSGLIAQDVEAVIKCFGHDFGGLQDHKKAGGDDIMTLGYSEFISPIIKAIQELADRLDRLSPPK